MYVENIHHNEKCINRIYPEGNEISLYNYGQREKSTSFLSIRTVRDTQLRTVSNQDRLRAERLENEVYVSRIVVDTFRHRRCPLTGAGTRQDAAAALSGDSPESAHQLALRIASPQLFIYCLH